MKFDLTSTELLDHLVKKSGSEIPLSVHELVDIVVSGKKLDLEFYFFKENSYLPQSLHLSNLEKKIFSTNLKLIEISELNKFDRFQAIEFADFDEEDDDEYIDYDPSDNSIRHCLGQFDDEEYNAYVNYEISEDELRNVNKWYRRKFGKKHEITLPKFELVTDYLALMFYYDSIIDDFEFLKKMGGETDEVFVEPSQKYRFKTHLNEFQITNLFNLLINNKCISRSTEIADFLWAFGVENDKSEVTKIKWEKADNLAVYFIDMLYENKQLINYNRMWRIGENVFGIKHMAQTKQNYLNNKKTEGKPKGFELIDNIFSSI